MAYTQKRARKKVLAKANKPEAHGVVLLVQLGAAPKKKPGGKVDGALAKGHLGKRARGGVAKRADGGQTGGWDPVANEPTDSFDPVDNGRDESPINNRPVGQNFSRLMAQPNMLSRFATWLGNQSAEANPESTTPVPGVPGISMSGMKPALQSMLGGKYEGSLNNGRSRQRPSNQSGSTDSFEPPMAQPGGAAQLPDRSYEGERGRPFSGPANPPVISAPSGPTKVPPSTQRPASNQSSPAERSDSDLLNDYYFAHPISSGWGTPQGARDYIKSQRTSVLPDVYQDGGAVGRAKGGRLTSSSRNALPSDDFALPGRRYPIEDKSHAVAAKGRVTQFGNSEEKARVRSAVSRRYPGLGKD